MQYYKNSEIAELLNVSNTSVFRWVESAMEGKNGLQIEKDGSKYKILKTKNNEAELNRLKEEGQKYRVHTTHKPVQMSNNLHTYFTDQQIIEITNTIKTKNQIPLKFAYTNRGGTSWNDFSKQGGNSQKQNGKNLSVNLEELISCSSPYLMKHADNYQKINLINIGRGNMRGLIELMKSLDNANKLKSLVCVDISDELLEITKNEIHNQFPNLESEFYLADIDNQNVEEIVFKSKTGIGEVNFVLLLGSTYGSLMNRIRVLENLRASLDSEDLLIISNLKQNTKTVTKLDHLLTDDNFRTSILWIPKLLGIDTELCALKGKFSHTTGIREIELKLDKSYTLEIGVLESKRQLELIKGVGLTLWRHHTSNIQGFLAELEIADLQSISYLSDPEDSYILNICKVKAL